MVHYPPEISSRFEKCLAITGCISYYGVGILTPVEGNMNTEKYISVLDDNVWPVIARHFSNRLDISGG
jgi:hypothetical protein